ncbi:hypothetical protein ACQ4PT_048983 [Festuca glaucescens]
MGIIFALNASCRVGKIRIHVDRGQASSGVGESSGGRASCLSTVAASANSVRHRAPCRSTAAPSVPSASGSQIVPAVDVEDDAEIEDQSPQDDEDELMFPELVDRCSKQAMEDQYMEDIAQGARFDDTDDEEKDENNDSLVLADYEGDDLPTIEWNRADPQLAEGTVFQMMMDCRNALTTYCILSKNDYEVIKSEPGRFTVKCPYKRCRWRLHASTMLRSTLVQIKKNPVVHTCPPRGGVPEVKSKLAKTRLCKNEVDLAFGMEDQAGAANAEENEAAIQNEEIEAAIQHEEIEAAIQPMEIEAEIQHEEIEAAIQPMD